MILLSYQEYHYYISGTFECVTMRMSTVSAVLVARELFATQNSLLRQLNESLLSKWGKIHVS